MSSPTFSHVGTPTFAAHSLVSGHIEVIFGPMFSGKSSELLRRIQRFTIAQKKCLVIKYVADTRYSQNQMSTHDKHMIPALPCKQLQDARSQAVDYDIIGVDEGQFFPDLVEFCEDMANAGKVVIVAALDGTFQRKPFPGVMELVPLAESITKLTAVCMRCFGSAAFTKRTSNDTAVECIGGADKYEAVCRSCFRNEDAINGKPKASAIVGVKRAANTAIDINDENKGVTITLSDPLSKRVHLNSDQSA